MSKISLTKTGRCLGVIFLSSVVFLASCASQKPDGSTPLDLGVSEAALLDDSVKATPVLDDSSIFADLKAAPADGDQTKTVSASIDDSAPFYRPIGGESLGRVAYTLYGARSRVGELQKENPGVALNEKLTAGQRIYFKFERLKPKAILLTKDLIDRYPQQLAQVIGRSLVGSTTQVVVAQGETLQGLSQRLYGTTRYWTEIYLLNREVLESYDKVASGLTLHVAKRDSSLSLNSQTAAPKANKRFTQDTGLDTPPQPTPAAMQPVLPKEETKPIEETTPALVDPIPDTSSMASESHTTLPTQSVAPTVNTTSPANTPLQTTGAPVSTIGGLSSTGLRRLLYGLAVLLVGALAFYFTRPSKKNFDMLDMTTQDSAPRPKLGNPRDQNKQGLG